MKRRTITSVALSLTLALFLIPSASAECQGGNKVTQNFHQVYNLAADGRVALENINGNAQIEAWDSNQVQIDAVKTACSQEDLDSVKIDVRGSQDAVRIATNYPKKSNSGNDHSVNVEYKIKMPRKSRLDRVELVNGSLTMKGVGGEVNASCVYGIIRAQGLQGPTHLSTVNGGLEADFDQVTRPEIDLESVNGSVSLTLPSAANAKISADTVHGGIKSDFPASIESQMFAGRELRGQLGNGDGHIRINNVNGSISIHRR